MIEITLLNYLKEVLEEPVYYVIPKGEAVSDEYVLIQKTSSSRQNHIDHATFALQSYGRSLHSAMLLNKKVKAAMDALITVDGISASRLNSDYNFTDMQSKNYRYQAVYEITYKEE